MAEFLTVNLGLILKNQKSIADAKSIEKETGSTQTQKRDPSKVFDWETELEDRLAENKKLESNERKSDYEVESQFFEDYFTHGDSAWDDNTAELLLGLGDPLRKAIKVLGFNPNVNPLLGFLTNNYVLNNLLMPKHLNVNTFKAIYNAVSKRLVADSEFMAQNDYNLIYCQDLYKRSATEILEYLTLQKNVLSTTASTYTKADQDRNKKVFFKLTGIQELNKITKRYPAKSYDRNVKLKAAIDDLPAGTKLPAASSSDTVLNDVAFVKVLLDKVDDTNKETANKDNESNDSKYSSTVSTLARKLGTNSAHALAALQYLNITTNVPDVRAALNHAVFKNVSMEALIAASSAVNKLMKDAALSDSEVKAFVTMLLNKL